MVTTCVRIKPLHPEISIHILHTVFSTFWKVLTRRICLTVKSFFCCWPFSLFSWPQYVIYRWYCKEKLDASQSLEGKRLILILLGGEGSWEWSFFQQRTKLQTSTLSYECDQIQSTLHVLVYQGLRSRVSALLTQLTLWALGHVQSTIKTRADSIHQLLVDWCSKILTVAFFSASHRPSIAVVRVIRQKDLACNPGQVK